MIFQSSSRDQCATQHAIVCEMAGRDVSAPEQIKHYNLEVFDRSDDEGQNLRELHLKFKAPIDEDRNTPVARYDMRIMASHPKDREFKYKYSLANPLTYI